MSIKLFLKNLIIFAATIGCAILIGTQAPYVLQQLKGPFEKGDYSIHVAQRDSKLTLYGTTTCEFCIAARAYLHEKKIPFDDVIIDKSPAGNERFKALNQRGVPVLVSKERLLAGFNREAYAELGNLVYERQK